MIKLLLVDDEPSLLDVGKLFLEKAGDFEVDISLSADEALNILEDEKNGTYEAVVSDYEMPGKNGIEFLKELRGRKNNIPFIIFTGKGREDVVIEAIESGADYYVQKGGSPKPQFAELIHKIKKAVEKKKTDDERLYDNIRIDASLKIVSNKNLSFIEIIHNTIKESVRFTGSEFGYAVITDGDENPSCIISSENPVLTKYDNMILADVFGEDNFFILLKKGSLKSSLTVNDNSDKGHGDGFSVDKKHLASRYMAVSLYEDNRAAIILVVANKKRPYDAADRRQLKLFINSMWTIAERRRTEEELRAANEQLAAAFEQLKAADEVMQNQLLRLEENERKLKDSEESLSLAIEGAELGIWDSDINTKRQTVNKIWADMIGYTCAEVDNVPDFWRKHVHPADLPRVLESIDDYALGKTDRYNSEFRMRCKNGSWKWIASTGRVSERDIDNNPQRISGIHIDITDLVAAGKSLKIARKKLKMLFGITRHDISNQLMLISGNVEILKGLNVLGPAEYKNLKTISDSAEVINNHMDFVASYMNMGLNEPVWQSVSDLIMRASDEINRASYEYDEALFSLRVLADPMFYSVLYNIIENSVRHSEGAVKIRIGFEESDGSGIITIEDNGPGISPDKKDLIFNRGFGLNKGTGLYIAREILSVNGIDLTETGTFGKGAKFEIKLPDDLYLIKKS
ncbi:MAG: PAS domain-containing protein [Methanomicrobiaceae archaeon]|nr:PAS domain-containing protein [Methanomicrobiaceae archaeon]